MNERDALVVRTDAERSGDDVRVTLTVDLPAGVHIEPHQPAEPYLIPTVADVTGLSDVTVEYPAPTVKDLGRHGLTLTVLEGSVVFAVSGRVGAGTKRIGGTLHFQPCVGGACLPPRTIQWQAPLFSSCSYSVLDALTSGIGALAR
jgi:DsbC/DsbD-like thiol-disulfide interchange protein